MNEQERAAREFSDIFTALVDMSNNIDVRCNTTLLERNVLRSAIELVRSISESVGDRASKSRW